MKLMYQFSANEPMYPKDWILIIALLLIILLTTVAKSQNQSSFYQQLNEYRVLHKLPPLKVSDRLARRSLRWARVMSSRAGCFHGTNGLDGMEVVASGDTDSVLQLWLHSKQHRQILLSPKATMIGFAIYRKKYVAKLI
jgi:uncharacterized protein YkwD